MKTCLKFRNICETDDVPCMISATMVFARDLELPGFPTKKRGIRSSMETTIMNTFSLRALFFAIFLSKLTFSRKTSWHLLKKSIFKGKLQAIKKTTKMKQQILEANMCSFHKTENEFRMLIILKHLNFRRFFHKCSICKLKFTCRKKSG